MLGSRLVERERLRRLFEAIESELFRFPAVDAVAFRRKLDAALAVQ